MKYPTAWSYSALMAYEGCPRRFKYENVEKRDKPTPPHFRKGFKVHDDAAKFLAKETDIFPVSCVAFRDEFYELRNLDPIVEQKWSFTEAYKPTGYFAKDVKLRVVLDAGLVYSDGTADVIDHKTGKFYEDGYMDQLGLFSAATIKMFPEVKHVTARLWYLEENVEKVEEFSKNAALAYLRDLEGRAEVMLNDRDYPPKPSWRCRNCHFRRENGGPCEFG